MLKTFKKSIALFVAIVFVMSLVPFGVMAEVEDKASIIIPFENVAHSRGGDSGDSHQNLAASGTAIRVNSGTGKSSRHGYVQFDFSGYEEILQNEGTTLDFCVSIAASADRPCTDFQLYAFGDYVDGYNSADITYNSAAKLGLHKFDEGLLIFEKADGIKYTTSTPISGPVNKENFMRMLNSGTDDSVLTVVVKAVSGEHYIYPFNSGNNITKGIKINYKNSEINNEDYVNKLVSELTWDIISSDDQNNVISALNLPKKYYGAGIDWSSSNEDVVNSSSGEVVPNINANTNVTLTAKATYTSALGDTVIASKEFKIVVPKPVIDYETVVPGTLYDGVEDYVGNTGSNSTHVPVVTKVPGIAGKADMCYELHDANGPRRFDFKKAADWTILDRDIFEFDVCIPSDCYGFYPQLMLYQDKDALGEDTSANSEFYFKHDGVYSGRGGDLIFSWDGGKWHHVAILTPGIVSSDASGIEYDRTIKIYVDGVLKETISLYKADYPAPRGIKNLRTNGLCPVSDYTEDQIWDTTACYLDNIRWTYGDIDTILAYNTKSSVVSATDDIDEIGGNLTVVTAGATVKDIIDSVTIDEDAVAKVYDAQWNLLDETAVVADGYTLVVADRNGTTEERAYSYYTIRVVDGKTAFDAAYITLDSATGAVTGNVKVYNYSGTDAEYQLYLAIYNDKELKTLIPAKLDAKTGKASFAAPAGTLADGETAKLLVWDINGVDPEIKSVSVTR